MVIIAVSYDSTSLNKRIRMLEKSGHIVMPASSKASCLKSIETANYHLLLIGSTVPAPDREEFAKLSRTLRPLSKIISVERPNSARLKLADKHVVAGNEELLLVAITSLVSGDSESDLEERRR